MDGECIGWVGRVVGGDQLAGSSQFALLFYRAD